MQISNFDYVNVGSSYPTNFNIGIVEGHESHGVYASANIGGSMVQILELRKNKDGEIALFNYQFKDMRLPSVWKDSEILWKNY